MLKMLFTGFSYLGYLLKAKTPHGVHSPFVYDFVTKVLYDKTYYVNYKRVEEQRQRLLKNKNLIEIEDFGHASGKFGYHTYLRKVRDVVKRSSITPKQGQLLHRIIKYIKPEIILEMGTSAGISSIYQVSASPDSFYIGIEGSATTAALAEENLKRFSHHNNYSMVIGNFDVMLQNVLEKIDKLDYVFIDGNHNYKSTIKYFNQLLPLTHADSVLIFHDIYWSKGMVQAWEEIKRNEKVVITLDLFFMGIVFFKPGITKQDFIIKF